MTSGRTDLRTVVDSEEIAARGRALRTSVPTAAHDHAAAGSARPDVLSFIQDSNEARLAHLIPLRIGRMISSPFAFFRGAAGLMAADLADSPVTGLTAQLCGDAHAANFGLYGTARGDIVMDINDFDETMPGPWEWDLKRLAASLVLAGRHAGMPESDCAVAAEDVVKSYRRTTRQLAALPLLQSWNALTDKSALKRAKAHDLLDVFDQATRKARRNTSAQVAAKWAERPDGHETGIQHGRFIDDPPLLTRVDHARADAVIEGLERYVETLHASRQHLIGRFAVCDVALRIVGTGSVGLRNYLAMLHGNRDEVLVLQLKQANRSALAAYLPATAPQHEGERIVRGARLVQAETDILLGWTTIDGLPYIVRQFRNLKGVIDPTSLDSDHLDDYGRLAGALLARAHARSLDPRLLAGYLEDDEDLDEAIGRFAVRYADQTETDHATLVDAVRDRRISVQQA